MRKLVGVSIALAIVGVAAIASATAGSVATVPSSLSVWNPVVSPAGTYVTTSPNETSSTLHRVASDEANALVTIPAPTVGGFWTTFESFPAFAR